MMDLEALSNAAGPLPDSLNEVRAHANLLLMSEVAVLIHDLGKLSKHFIESKSADSSLADQFKGFQHHLILRRLRLQKEPLLDPVPSCSGQPDDAWAERWWDTVRGPKSPGRKAFRDQWNTEGAIDHDFLWGGTQTQDEELIVLLNTYEALLTLPWAGSEVCRLGDPLENHHRCWRPPNETPWLCHLTAACDPLDSAVDKACLNYDGANQKPPARISTAFGYEGDAQGRHLPERWFEIDLERVEEERHAFCRGLKAALEKLRSSMDQGADGEHLTAAVSRCRKKVVRLARQHFVHALGETRRSANDVTLWDHSFAVASMAKAALAGQLIQYRCATSVAAPNHSTFRRVLQWRLLCIAFDGIGLVGKGQKMADIIANWNLVQTAKDRLRDLFEVHLPIGNCVYDDENGIYFLAPGTVEENGACVLQTEEEAYLRTLVQRVLDEPELGGGELKAAVWLSEPDKSLTQLGTEIADGPRRLAGTSPRPTTWAAAWTAFQPEADPTERRQGMDAHIRCPGICVEGKRSRALCPHAQAGDPWCELIVRNADGALSTPNITICPVCRIRPKCEQQEICPTCYERRSGRAQKWLRQPKRPTIWIEEIADRQNRCALIVGHFDLSRWLNGSRVPTVLAQSLEWWNRHSKTNSQAPFQHALVQAQRVLNVFTTSDSAVAHAGLEAYKRFVFAKHTTGFTATSPVPGMRQGLEQELAEHGFSAGVPGQDDFLWRIFGKYASHGRLRRIWGTTAAFWEEVEKLVLPEVPGVKGVADPTRLRRVVLEVEWEDGGNAGRLAYELKMEGPEGRQIRCQVFAVEAAKPGTDRLLTIQNLGALPHWPGEERTWESFTLYLQEFRRVQIVSEPGSRLPIPERTGTIKTVLTQNDWLADRQSSQEEEALAIPEGADYLPFIPILTSPVSFMAVIPAAEGLDAVRQIKQKYDLEFARVKDRLPLHLGAIYFNRRYPLYIALDAGKRMLSELPRRAQHDLTWTLREAVDGNGQVTLRFENGCEWSVPTRTGDPCVADECHPRFFVEAGGSLGQAVEQARTYFGSGPESLSGKRRQPVLGVQDLPGLPGAGKGLGIVVQPGRLDFEYLDVTVRRLELRYHGEESNGTVRRTRDHDEQRRRLPGGEMRGRRPYFLDELDLHDRLWNALLCSVPERVKQPQRLKYLEGSLKALGALIDRAYSLWPGRLCGGSSDATAFRDFMRNAFPNVLRRDWWGKKETPQEQLIRAAADGTLFDLMELRLFLVKGAAQPEEERVSESVEEEETVHA